MMTLETGMRQCIICNENKALTEYYKLNKDKAGRQLKCKSCHCSRQREFRKENKARLKAQTRFRRETLKQRAVNYKGGKCEDCLAQFPLCVYDFHHVDPTTKDNDVGSMIQSSWKFVKDELDKCVLLCANCHRIRHYTQ